MSVGKKAGKGFFSFLYRSMLEKFMGMITMIVLAKKLGPYDFGLVIITDTLLTLISAFGTTGLAEYLLAYRKDDVDEVFKAAFWFNIVVSLGVFLLFIGIAPFWAHYQNDHRIFTISLISGVIFLFSQLQSVPKTWLSKNLMFDTQVKIQAPFIIIIPIAKILAVYMGFGVYSLVLPNLIFQPLLTFIFYARTRLKPGFNIYLDRWKEIYHFTKYLIGSSLLSRIADQGDEIILSKRLGLDQLGIFDMAMRMSDIFTAPLVAVSNNILSSVLPKFTNDKDRFYDYYIRFIKAFAFVVFPVLSIMFLTSRPVILFLYGPKWIGAVQPMKILIIYAAMRAVTSSYGSVMNSFHLNKKSFLVTAVYTPFHLIGSVIGSSFGVSGVAASLVLIRFIFINWSIAQMMQAMSMKFIQWYQSIAPYMLGCLLIVAILTFPISYYLFETRIENAILIVCTATVFIISYYLYFMLFLRSESRKVSAFIGATFPKIQKPFNIAFKL